MIILKSEIEESNLNLKLYRLTLVNHGRCVTVLVRFPTLTMWLIRGDAHSQANIHTTSVRPLSSPAEKPIKKVFCFADNPAITLWPFNCFLKNAC